MFYSAYRHRRLEESDLLTKVSFGSKADAPHAIALATDMCMVHGRFPSTKVAFCSKELKRDQLTKQVHLPLLDAGGTRRADIASPGRTFRGIRVVQGRHSCRQRAEQRARAYLPHFVILKKMHIRARPCPHTPKFLLMKNHPTSSMKKA